ncbi:TPA: fimbrial biogenesis chaperone [Morganella morganii]
MMIRRCLLNTAALLFAVTAAQAGNLSQEQDGITLSNTRVIYPGDARNGITYTLTNNTPRPYLLQSRVLPYGDSTPEDGTGEAKKMPFIVLPPLTRFEPDTALTLRIRLTQNALPQDRESVFTLALNAIPAQTDTGEQTRLIMSTQNNLKLFYRPAGLPPADEAVLAEQPVFRRNGNTLTVKNPSPFYITFSSLSAGNTDIDLRNARMVAPFSEQSWPLPAGAAGDLRWQLITDDGRPGEIVTRPAG